MQEVVVKGVKDGVLQIALSGEIDLGNADAFYQAVMSGYSETSSDICFDYIISHHDRGSPFWRAGEFRDLN